MPHVCAAVFRFPLRQSSNNSNSRISNMMCSMLASLRTDYLTRTAERDLRRQKSTTRGKINVNNVSARAAQAWRRDYLSSHASGGIIAIRKTFLRDLMDFSHSIKSTLPSCWDGKSLQRVYDGVWIPTSSMTT